ncbi:hypothetical protein D3C84_1086680 [compost metagenome]
MFLIKDHIIAQIIETKFIVRAICDIAGISFLLLCVRQSVQVAADRQAEKLVHLTHQLTIALRQVIVDRYDVNALAEQRVQINRQRTD